MKKILSFIMFIVVLFSLSGCGGDVSDAKIKEVKSKIFTSDDINSAINVIVDEFKLSWDGCKLTEIYYAGDDFQKDYQEWKDRYDKDEVIVLLSSFDVDSSCGDGSLNPNSTYDNWNWILVRNKDENWKHVDHGY